MIAIDTNVLLRYLLADDVKQHNKAKKLMMGGLPVLITDVVLTEIVWTLTGKRFQFDKASICHVVRSLVGDQNFVFEDSQVVWSALNDYENSKIIRGKCLDFADALFVHKSIFTAKSRGITFDGFYSFDKAIEQLAGTKTLT